MLTRRTFQSGLALGFGSLLPPGLALVGIAPSHAKPMVPSDPTAPKSKEAFGASQARLAARLMTSIAGSVAKPGRTPLPREGNVVVSPMGAALSMSVVALLSPDAMRRSLALALQFGEGFPDPFSDALQRGGAIADAARTDGFPLAASNLLMLDTTSEPFAFTLDGMRRRGIEVDVEDLGSHDAVNRANDWVKERTKGLVPSILNAPPGKGGLVALDALHFKDAWKVPFDPVRSVDAPFRDAYGRILKARMMAVEGTFRIRQSNGLAGVILPFGSPRFSIVLATRTDRSAHPAALVSDVGSWLDGSGFTRSTCDLTIPRLDLAGSYDLIGPLAALGMRNDPLVGLGGGAPRLRAVAQKSVLKLDEKGVEAAAATAATLSRSIATDEPRLVFDKPFLFSLRDEESGFVVLAGYVGTIDDKGGA